FFTYQIRLAMSVSSNVEKWGNAHSPGFLDILRVALGIFITYKGLYFLTHMHDLQMTTAGINIYFAGAALAHYVVFAHILGGPLIAVGLFTRRSEEHTSELQSRENLVCRLLLEKKTRTANQCIYTDMTST